MLHELGWSAQFKDKDTGEELLFDFDFVESLILNKLRVIDIEIEATEEPLIFFSDSDTFNNIHNRSRRLFGDTPREYQKNFRYERAVSRPYKGARVDNKPFHFYNIFAYMHGHYDTIISTDGLEADDELGIYQCSTDEPTIICSRDKDLRMIPGNHYSWECGKQLSIGPHYTDDIGSLELINNKKLLGYGKKFFYSQLLTGDVVDGIPGLKGYGPVAAYSVVEPCATEKQMFEAVKAEYKSKGASLEYFKEQADLLWIHRERGKGYEFPT